jgi:hypothetical protein
MNPTGTCTKQLINEAFVHQNNIGWGHFVQGCLLLHWKLCIAEYYRHHQPGDTYNLATLMDDKIC